MRIAVVLVLAAVLGLQASAQTQPKRSFFTDTDYNAYFSSGVRHFESPTEKSRAVETQTFSNGKSMVSVIEAMPKWNPSSLYPYVKVQSLFAQRRGFMDKRLNARVIQTSEADFQELATYSVWLSNDDRPAVSHSDVRIGSMLGYYRSIAEDRGMSTTAVDDDLRSYMIGSWTVRCEFLQDERYEVECIQTQMNTGAESIRRYLKRTGMG